MNRVEEFAMYEKTLFAGWGDMDFNSHMRNTAYLDKSADVRMMFFAENGFPMARFVELRLGPVVMKDEVEYFREVGLLESLRVTLSIAALADDGNRCHIRNELYRPDGKLGARVTSVVGWLDLAARKLTLPPDDLLVALAALPRTADFRVLPSGLK
jgi:acyl-CoA thioester hydrolase